MAATKSNFEYRTGTSGSYTAVPARLIKSIKQTNESLASEDSGRSDDGVMHINFIKSKLRKWEVELVPCTTDDYTTLLSAIQGKKYYVNIFDQSTGSEVTNLHVYTSNTTSDCYSGVLYNGLYQGISFSIIEMGD